MVVVLETMVGFMDEQLPYTIGALIGSTISHLFNYLSDKREMERLRAQIAKLESENEDLENELDRMRARYNELLDRTNR